VACATGQHGVSSRKTPNSGVDAGEGATGMTAVMVPSPWTARIMAGMPTDTKNACLACKRTSAVTPLIRLEYQNTAYWICPQHLPVLIHNPAELIGMLPDAERLSPAEHHD
jgi:hypothetical protein